MDYNKYVSRQARYKGEKTRAIILDYIKEYIAEHGQPPMLVEISKEIGMCVSTVSKQVQRLVEDGQLVIDYNSKAKRNIRLPKED